MILEGILVDGNDGLSLIQRGDGNLLFVAGTLRNGVARAVLGERERKPLRVCRRARLRCYKALRDLLHDGFKIRNDKRNAVDLCNVRNRFRQIIREREIGKHHGNDIFVMGKCVLDLLTNPIFRIHTAIQPVRRQNENEIVAIFNCCQNSCVKITVFDGIKIIKNRITKILERLANQLCGNIPARSSIRNKYLFSHDVTFPSLYLF